MATADADLAATAETAQAAEFKAALEAPKLVQQLFTEPQTNPGPGFTQPDLSLPLINEPAQTNPAAAITTLAPLQFLIGSWTNQNIGTSGQGGPAAPFSYNVMPLPQTSTDAPQGYILKNFSYFEEMTFSPIHGAAPNRGGTGTQNGNTLFYEQRVYFADGPAAQALVHAENGSWLYLNDVLQLDGPYGDGIDGTGVSTDTIPGTPPTQTYNIAKQVSVPHGNSILATGSYVIGTGAPTIPNPSALPIGIDLTPYQTQSPGNLDVALTANPNQALIDALAIQAPTSFIAITVDSDLDQLPPLNIPFEQQHCKVTRYQMTLWLESFAPAGSPPDYTQLQYSQTITMEVPVTPTGATTPTLVSFPHVTCNTMTKVA